MSPTEIESAEHKRPAGRLGFAEEEEESENRSSSEKSEKDE